MIKRHLLVGVAHPMMNPISEHIGWWISLTCIDTLKISSVSKYSCKQAFDLKKKKIQSKIHVKAKLFDHIYTK